MKGKYIVGVLITVSSTEALFGMSNSLSSKSEDYCNWRENLREANYRRTLKRLGHPNDEYSALLSLTDLAGIFKASFQGLLGLIWGYNDTESTSQCALPSVKIPSWCLNPLIILAFMFFLQILVLFCSAVAHMIVNGTSVSAEDDAEDPSAVEDAKYAEQLPPDLGIRWSPQRQAMINYDQNNEAPARRLRVTFQVTDRVRR